MNPLSLLSFFAFLLCIYFGLHTLRREPNAWLTRIFLLYCLTGAFWAWGYIFIYPSTDPADTWYWYRFSSIGWCFIHSTFLHFVFILTKKRWALTRKWFMALIYLPSCVLLWRSMTGILVAKNFYSTPWGMAEVLATESIWFNLYGLYNMVYLFVSCMILLYWGKSSGVMRFKKQARIIVITTITSFLIASFLNLVMPEMGVHFPSVGAYLGILFLFGAWYAMSKYKLMVITPEIAAGEIISKMMDIMILADPNDNIITVNHQGIALLGTSLAELRKKMIYEIIAESGAYRQQMDSLKKHEIENFQMEGHLTTRTGEPIPAKFFISEIKDNSGEVVGTVLVANDQRSTIELNATLERLRYTNNELIKTRDALWGEMQIAKKIQTVLLPLAPKIPNYQVAAYLNPADEVGGDYYDVINTPGRDWLIIGDVSGHGVPAGLVMMMIQISIHVIIRNFPEITPSELLEKVNLAVTPHIKQIDSSKYMTITAYAVHKDGRMAFSGLHQDTLIYRAGTKEIEIVSTTGMWIGIMDDIHGTISDNTLQLNPGDILLAYTDGITESCNEKTDFPDKEFLPSMYGQKRLIEVFRKTIDLPVEEIKKNIIASLEDYQCHDDVTLIVMKREK